MAEITPDMIGGRISLQTSLGETFEGTVFTVDSGVVVIEQYESSNLADSKATYRMVSTSSVKGVKVLSEAPKGADGELPPIPEVDIKFAELREERAIAKAKDEAARINVKATARTQRIFDDLAKTMPCEWMERGTDLAILVMDNVLVSAPYGAEQCVGKAGEERLKERVQKVLAGIIGKIDQEPTGR